MFQERVQRRLAAILAADVVAYSRLVGVDETGTRARFNAHFNELIEPTVAGFKGRIVKTIGDGLLAEFASVVDAVQCAVEIQKGMSERNAGEAGDRRMDFRIGVNLGDIIIEGDDIHGDGVNVASRLEGLADPGGICISRAARDQIRDKLGYHLEDMGEVEVKNIARPIRAFRIRLGSGIDPVAKIKRAALRMPPAIAIIALGCVALIAISGAVWFNTLRDLFDQQIGGADIAVAKTAHRPALFVLPFKNLSGDPKQEYFSDGFTEDITSGLARIPGLMVIAKNTAFAFKNKNVELRSLGREFGVRYILEGSARQSDTRLRIDARLIEVASGTYVWAARYDRPLKDIFIVQDMLVNRIVGSVAARLRHHEGQKATAASQKTLAAYDLTLRGRMLFRTNTLDAMKEARSVLHRAIKIDPKYARAYSVLAQVEQYFFTSRVSEEYASSETAKRVLEAAARAVRLSPEDAFNHAVNGMALRLKNDYDGAALEARRARKLAPNDPEVLATVSVILLSVGDYKASVDTMRLAWSLDPYLSPVYIGAVLSQGLFALGDYKASKDVALDCLRRAPRDVRCLESLVRALGELGPADEAKKAAADLLKLSPNFTIAEYVRRASKNRRDKAAIKRWADGLRKAGLPD